MTHHNTGAATGLGFDPIWLLALSAEQARRARIDRANAREQRYEQRRRANARMSGNGARERARRLGKRA